MLSRDDLARVDALARRALNGHASVEIGRRAQPAADRAHYRRGGQAAEARRAGSILKRTGGQTSSHAH